MKIELIQLCKTHLFNILLDLILYKYTEMQFSKHNQNNIKQNSLIEIQKNYI